MMLAVYVSSIVRAIIGLHNLINNKIANKEHEQKLAAAEKEAEQKEQEKKEAGTCPVTEWLML